MNHIKEKLAKLKMEERTEFVEVLKKQSKVGDFAICFEKKNVESI